MSISPALRASARSAYRDVLRASAFTFSGDETVLKAFKLKMREDAIKLRGETDPILFEKNIILTSEIAGVLRKNVVQAVKVKDALNERDKETWNLRLTKYTELGSNESIKNPPPIESDRRNRKLEKEAQHSPDVARPDSIIPRYYSSLKKAHKQRNIPTLNEDDLEESFVRGSGPGGQSINKTQNNVQLLHKPTGIRVTCQETRSLQTNRMLARRLIVEKLDKIHNPGLSKGELQRARQRERERRRRKKAKNKIK